jgi:hypothetical protein
MNAGIRTELAKVMIADRQREAAHAATVAQARAARRASAQTRGADGAGAGARSGETMARSGGTVARRVRALLRTRTA